MHAFVMDDEHLRLATMLVTFLLYRRYLHGMLGAFSVWTLLHYSLASWQSLDHCERALLSFVYKNVTGRN